MRNIVLILQAKGNRPKSLTEFTVNVYFCNYHVIASRQCLSDGVAISKNGRLLRQVGLDMLLRNYSTNILPRNDM
jgi:hypothetical protein